MAACIRIQALVSLFWNINFHALDCVPSVGMEFISVSQSGWLSPGAPFIHPPSGAHVCLPGERDLFFMSPFDTINTHLQTHRHCLIAIYSCVILSHLCRTIRQAVDMFFHSGKDRERNYRIDPGISSNRRIMAMAARFRRTGVLMDDIIDFFGEFSKISKKSSPPC